MYQTFLRAAFKQHRSVYIYRRPSRYHTMVEAEEKSWCMVCKNPLPEADHGVANGVLQIFHCSGCTQRVKQVWYDYSVSTRGRRRKRSVVWSELQLEVFR